MDTLILTFFLLVGMAALIWIGYQLAVDKLHEDQNQVEQQKAALKAEWQQLDATRRVRSVFLSAQRAMQAEAARMSWPTDDHDQEAGR
jgi:predicted Holliday junction resolvase-like endonuclease